jgi:hypothetical protein
MNTLIDAKLIEMICLCLLSWRLSIFLIFIGGCIIYDFAWNVLLGLEMGGGGVEWDLVSPVWAAGDPCLTLAAAASSPLSRRAAAGILRGREVGGGGASHSSSRWKFGADAAARAGRPPR